MHAAAQTLPHKKLPADRARAKHGQKRAPLLVLGALGVVFGDIGTSPLYGLRQCFQNLHASRAEPPEVLGILSLIVWALVLVVCVKYLSFIIRADYEGEGGTLALLALVLSRKPRRETERPGAFILMVLFGSALLYGDGVITPAISVLSAVEGLKIALPTANGFIVPLSLGILIGLFLLQCRGSGQVGFLFGPVMALWFVSIAILGVGGVMQAPQILKALNPVEALSFFLHHGWQGLSVLGGVVLCFSGAEALFADLGHFGRPPIVAAWYGLVLPALLLNYFGQGALMLLHPGGVSHPFFALVPRPLLYPAVALATAATVIASQALISGVFSLTQQAIHMGYFPRFEIIHTSREERGQVYIATINYALMAACIAVILAFQSSDRLGSAYGLAVVGTMTITSLTYFVVLRRVWKWSRLAAAALTAFFLSIDLPFLAGSLTKLASGAGLPLGLALIVFSIYWIWTAGRARYRRALDAWAWPIDKFRSEIKSWPERQEGTAIFLTSHRDTVPLIGRNHWLRQHARHQKIVLLTIAEEKVPYVRDDEAIMVEELGDDFWSVIASFGFMQHPDVSRALKSSQCRQIKIDWDRLVCYLPEAHAVYKGSWFKRRTTEIYQLLSHNSLSLSQYLRIPAGQIIHVGVRLEM